MIVEGIAEGGCFGCALGGVIIACGLNDLAKLAVGAGQAGMCFLNMHLAKLDTEVRFCESQC